MSFWKEENFYTILIGQVELLKLYAKLRCGSLSRQGNYNQACLFDAQKNRYTVTVRFSESQTTDISDEVWFVNIFFPRCLTEAHLLQIRSLKLTAFRDRQVTHTREKAVCPHRLFGVLALILALSFCIREIVGGAEDHDKHGVHASQWTLFKNGNPYCWVFPFWREIWYLHFNI